MIKLSCRKVVVWPFGRNLLVDFKSLLQDCYALTLVSLLREALGMIHQSMVFFFTILPKAKLVA